MEHKQSLAELLSEQKVELPAVPELLRGVLSNGFDESLTTEDYALMAQVNADFGEDLAERLAELTPDQVVYLCALARLGLGAGETKP